ncbi:Centrosomal protein 164kDa [Nesidiocoris tenuis]|uniref:Centrosomal protein 164kDa n=1 Tax=Nesidiocoris tenuis TaxID=355587 RepID=A0ABN7B900_9HEMI|nr:Centrosomal protein 164kDa [Nesidiocoris tenuis]
MMSNNTLHPSTIVCEEVFDENSHPSEEEVIEYAKRIGIDPQCEAHLLPIALKGLMQPLPKGWKPCLDASSNLYYYYNKFTKTSQWEHPLDFVYRNLVKLSRSEGYSSAAEDDSKATARGEDLKSFEEVSDLLLSTDKPVEPPGENMFIDKSGAKPHQPLLLRRKQLQNGIETPTSVSSLQVAKLMNLTMRENAAFSADDPIEPTVAPKLLTSEKASSVQSTPSAPKLLQPLQRSRTLDPIPTFTSNPNPDALPIRGILRESSFSGLPNRNLSKPNALSGDLAGSSTELEDEKKRSVRFDIRSQVSDDSDDSYSDDDGAPAMAGSSSADEDHHSNDNFNGEPSVTKSVKKLNITPEQLEMVNQKLNAINVNKMKQRFVNPHSAVGSLDNNSEEDTDSNNHSFKPLFVKTAAKSEKTGRFSVSKTVLDPPSDHVKLSEPETVEKCEPKMAADIKSSDDLELDEMEKIAKSKTAEKLAQIDEKITKEIQEKIMIMKLQQSETLSKLTSELMLEHDAEKDKILEEHKERLQTLKQSLDEDLRSLEQEVRNKNKAEIDELIEKLAAEREGFMAAAKAHHELLYKNSKDDLDERYKAEKSKIEADFESQLEAQKEKLQAEIDGVRVSEEAKIEELKAESEKKIEELRSHYDNLAKEDEAKFKRELAKMEADFATRLSALKLEKEAELVRVKTEWEDKITATGVQQRAALESLASDHERNMATLKGQFQREEDALKKSHSEQIEAWNARLKKLIDKEPNTMSVNRDFEKMRCEKRLLEDKYRSLKDKYVQLKTDMKIAVERKLQSRARRKKDVYGLDKEVEGETGDSKARNDKNKNNVTDTTISNDERLKHRAPKINIEPMPLKDPQREGLENDPSSDDQYTSLSLTLPTDDQRSLSISPVKNEPDIRRRHIRGRFRIETRREGLSPGGNVLDEVRSQLKELEEIEEQIPANSQGDTYLRYPFHGPGLSTSAEVDFYRHRVIVEQEAVRAARECLLQQKRELEARQNILRTNNNSSNMQQLQQQERDLTEMEVSLHRTRALLGEKMIRLRLLGQTLNRLVDDSPSPTKQLPAHKLDQALSPGAVSDEGSHPRTPLQLKPSRSHRRMPSNKAEIEARIQGLREWLEKPPSANIDWNQLTL